MRALQRGYPPDLPWVLVIPTQWHQADSCIWTANRRKATCQVVIFRVSTYLAWLRLPVFSRLQAFTHIIISNCKAWLISASAYIIFPNWLSHSLWTTQKTIALEQNTLLKQQWTRADTEVTGPKSHCSVKDSLTPQHPLRVGVSVVHEWKRLFPKHLLLTQTPPASTSACI